VYQNKPVENKGKGIKIERILQEELQLCSPLGSGEPNNRCP